MRISPKRCLYCHGLFTPDPRTAASQKTCAKTSCRRKRKRAAQAEFVKDNPTYFRGRYGQLKVWLAQHPGYLARYRAAHPAYREKNRQGCQKRRRRPRRFRNDIQVTIARRKIQGIQAIRGDDIQDTTRLRLDGLLALLVAPWRDDMQVPNAPAASPG